MKKLLSILIILLPISLFSQPGSSGLKFLLSYNSRISALGESYVTLSRNASATLGNPAGITGDNRTNIEIGVRQYIQDISSQYLLVKIGLSDDLFLGYHLLSSRVPDIEVRLRPGEAEGTFSSQDISTGLTFGYQYDDNLHFGTTLKYLFEKIYVDESNGYAIDFGVNYFLSNDLKFGVSLNNIGNMSELRNSSITLPTTLGIGSMYEMTLESINSNMTFSLEGHHNFNDEKMHFSFGVEPSYNDLVYLRLGYITGFDTKGFTAGLGITYRMLDISYSYTPFLLDLGNSHNISIGFLF